MSNSNMKIPVSKMLLQPGSMITAKPLVGFDVGPDLYHIVLFPEGDGSIGVFKDGDNFCARLSLDSFVAFYAEAKAGHIEGNG